MGEYWSTHWYQRHTYGTEIVRGLDVFALSASQFLSEIAAAALADGGGVFNQQQQFLFSGPRSRAWRRPTSISLSAAGSCRRHLETS